METLHMFIHTQVGRVCVWVWVYAIHYRFIYYTNTNSIKPEICNWCNFDADLRARARTRLILASFASSVGGDS